MARSSDAVAGGRSSLLASIRAGTSLKRVHRDEPVEQNGYPAANGAPNGRTSLMDAIRSGPQLKKRKQDSGSSSDLLVQIQAGAKLRRVKREEKPASAAPAGSSNTLQSALANSLANYRKFVQDDDDDDDCDDEEWA